MMELEDIIYFGDEAKLRLKKGITKLARAVSLTMGPGGRFANLGGNATKDGVSVSEYITLVDPIENMGADMIKQSASKTVSDAGDGTTTSTVLSYALIDSAPDEIKSVTEFTNGMKSALKDSISELNKMRIETPNREQLMAAALTSANGDEEIAEIVSNAVIEVGEGGIVEAIIGHTPNTTCEVTKGYKMDRGYLSTAYINIKEKGVFELTGNIYVLLIDGKLDNFRLVENLIRHIKENKGFLAIIAEDFSDDVLHNCLINYTRYGKSIIPIKAAEFGDRRTFGLEDLAIYLNEGKVHTVEELNSDKVRILTGTAEYIRVSQDYTILRRKEGDETALLDRIQQLKTLEQDAKNEFDAKKLKGRISQLSGGHATIKVGAVTEIEVNEKKDRYDDAIGAIQAALKEGVLPGGGCALFNVKKRLYKKESGKDSDFQKGYSCVLNALEMPAITIATNADLLELLKNDKELKEGFGLNAKTGKIVDLIKEGIIDPYKVTVSALTNAVSVASMVISTGVVIQNNFIKRD